MWKRWLVAFGLWLARQGGWEPPVCPRDHPTEVTSPVLATARSVTHEVEQRFSEASGEFKRREALRVLLNHFPNRPVRELALAIELGLP